MKTKRFLSVMLALVIVVSLLPMSIASAATSESIFDGGMGTETEPYLISTLKQLEAFRDSVNDGDDYSNMYVKLTADLDLEGSEENQWTPIGETVWNNETDTDDGGFAGTFDGDGHKITGLYINNSSDYQGLFGWVVGGATVKNLCIDGTVTGREYVGGVVGYNSEGTVENCNNTGSVTGIGDYVGGVVGNNDDTVKNCYNTGSVTGSNCVGGVTGNNYGPVENCYNTGSVTGSNCVGGVTGYNSSDSTVKNCYNTGSVSGSDFVGGVVGYNSSDGPVENCYYLETCAAEGTTFDCDEGTELSAEQMKDSTSFAYWDFTDTWVMGSLSPMLTAIPEKDTKNTADLLISTVEEFEKFRDNVNDGDDYSGKYVMLTADLDLAGSENNQWTPIGTETNQFKGTFNGDGHKITGLYINNSEEYQGLFGYVCEGATVKNLNVDGTVKGKLYVGGVVGRNNGTVANCYNTGNVSGSDVVGGVVGFNYGTVENCYNTGSVTGSGDFVVGGVVGYNDNDGTVENCYNTGSVTGSSCVGGVTGDNDGGTVKNCYNIGSVGGSYDVGGVVGYNSSNSTVENCYNTGSVSGSDYVGGVVGSNDDTVENCYNTGSVSGSYNVGGVAGDNCEGTVKNCYNTGSVSGSDFVGGVVGYNYEGTVENCYNTGSVTGSYSVGGVVGDNYGTVKNCYNTGSVTGSGYVGGVVGYNDGGTVENCYYLNTCAGDDTTFTNTLGDELTAEKMKNSASFNAWDFANTWFMGNLSPMLKAIPEKDTKNAADLLISTVGEFEAFRDSVNGGDDYSGKYVMLTADLDLEGSEENQWTPIGTETNQFKGKFNGDGHKIIGLYINDSEAEYQGLFGYVGEGGIIKNLNVDGTVTGSDCVGGVVGLNIGGTVENCCNTGSVSGSYSVGGVVGVNDEGTVENCCNTGSVTGSDFVGGVVGDNYGTVENCYNTGSVSGSEDVGGVTGDNDGGTVKNCYNTGNVSGSDFVGGVVGENYYGGTVENCYNTGSVSGSGYVGGVVGENYYGGTVENCYYLETCAAEGTTFTNTLGDELTAEKMKNSASFNAWDFTKVWKMGIERPLLRAIPEDESFGIRSTGTSTTKATATVFIPTAGIYTVIFADYENGRLAKLSSVQLPVTDAARGTHTVTYPADMTLGTDDKIMLWESLETLVPLCEAYVIK